MDWDVMIKDILSQRDTALSQLAALREELDRVSQSWHGMKQQNDDIKQRLADADRRNSAMVSLLHRALAVIRDEGWNELEADITAALNKPEEAKS